MSKIQITGAPKRGAKSMILVEVNAECDHCGILPPFTPIYSARDKHHLYGKACLLCVHLNLNESEKQKLRDLVVLKRQGYYEAKLNETKNLQIKDIIS